MEALISRITAAAGIDSALAEKAVGIILGFLQKEAPGAEVQGLIDALPGAGALIEAHAGQSGGLMGAMAGMMGGGGGIMGLGSQLMGAGLSMDQMSTVGKELFAYGREHAGEDAMGAIVAAIPGLGQFV